ncbi:MAG: trypsin-like peptidase domain-containing protein, partial [Clostridia bacterium]|nr:trypsin-like peptidase domain-containing protein [Clostridia bacterium]
SIVSYVQSRYGTSESTGTGIIMSEDGYIITNHHVIDGATAVYVAINGEEYQAAIVGSEAKSDIAVLKIEASGLQAAEFGSSAELVTGDSAIVIGNPLGLEFADTMTIGYVSATERVVQISEYIMTLIQVDAAVNPGNSGGPLINSQGQVVGVVNAKISQDAVEGIGFAIPIDTAMTIAQDLIDHGYVTNRPMLGITVQSISEQQAAYYGYEPGITVTEVSPGSCAEQGGMKVGDKILAFNGVEVSNATELNFEKDKCNVGDTVTITIERDGQQMDLTIVLSAGTAA